LVWREPALQNLVLLIKHFVETNILQLMQKSQLRDVLRNLTSHSNSCLVLELCCFFELKHLQLLLSDIFSLETHSKLLQHFFVLIALFFIVK
jgi:hypothetical protein